jgi:tRNA 2-thiocytidine biosynthesis protein TtcA
MSRLVAMSNATRLNIPRPPWTALGRHLESACRKALYEFKLVDGVEKLAIALSGGKDSIALLTLLAAISGRGMGPWELHAIHVSGEFSCGPGIGVEPLRQLCESLGAQFHLCLSSQKLETLECYSCSRERRRLIFQKALELGCTTVAFGHHQDDNVETALMNLLGKGEFAGHLPKIHFHAWDITLIRPLIFLKEDQIRQFAQMYGFARLTCQCPVGQTSRRKQVKQLLEQIQELYPDAVSNISQSILREGSQKAARHAASASTPLVGDQS